MYKNLAAEMARRSISVNKIAACLNVSEKTARNYLHGNTKIPFDRATLIRRNFFSNLSLEYLFADDDGKEEL